jgi:hypothetical protein
MFTKIIFCLPKTKHVNPLFGYKGGVTIYHKKILISFLSILILVILYRFSFYYLANPALSRDSIKQTSSEDSISLIDAYNLALKEATSWNENAQLVLITSVDDDELNLAGSDGKRRKWNLLFANPDVEETLQVSINDNTISKTTINKENTLENMIIKPDSIKIDSTIILEKAKKDFDLKPGINWANGYHFSLMNNGAQTFLTVTGLTKNDLFTQIFYDSVTGNYLGSKVESKENN